MNIGKPLMNSELRCLWAKCQYPLEWFDGEKWNNCTTDPCWSLPMRMCLPYDSKGYKLKKRRYKQLTILDIKWDDNGILIINDYKGEDCVKFWLDCPVPTYNYYWIHNDKGRYFKLGKLSEAVDQVGFVGYSKECGGEISSVTTNANYVVIQ